MKRPLIAAIVLAMTLPAAGAVTDVKAFWRDGQTFLTWKEDAAATGEWYHVYASYKPITGGDLSAAKLIAKIPRGSNHFGFFRNLNTSRGFFKDLAAEDWAKSIQIVDDEANAKRLPDGTGLFVRTIHKPGRMYYAVVRAVDGKEDGPEGVAATAEPVDEKVAPPGAVLLKKLGERYYVYAFFTDFDVWNPDGVEDNWEGYAHVFHIRAPDPKKKGVGPEPYPVCFRLHAYSAWRDWNIPYCWPGTHVCVRLLDYHLTWWYGYSDRLPRLEGRPRVPPAGKVVNFTEQRLLQVARWLAGAPKNFPFRVDPAQFSVMGGSMGGTGTHYVGLRNGDIFAGAFADEGIFNWAAPPKFNHWAPNVAPKFGPQGRNDMTNEGERVYDLLDLPRWVAGRPEREMPFLSIGQGSIDTVIPFHGLVRYFKALEAGKHPFAAGWSMVGHRPWAGSRSPMDYKLLRRDEVVPAFANASCNSPLRSGFRICTKAVSFTDKTLTIEAGQIKDAAGENVDGSFPPNLAGKTLVLGPSDINRDRFTIASNTPTELTIKEGDLTEYVPPLTNWGLHVLKQQIKKAEGKEREPTEREKRAAAINRKHSILIIDGPPRGCWNGHFAWSTRNQNFDPKSVEDDIVDEPGRLAICIRLGKNSFQELTAPTATADVTPRRARRFKPAPGEKVHWENWDLSDPKAPRKLAEGDTPADAHGLVTVKQFTIGQAGWGNRLVLTKR